MREREIDRYNSPYFQEKGKKILILHIFFCTFALLHMTDLGNPHAVSSFTKKGPFFVVIARYSAIARSASLSFNIHLLTNDS